MSDPHAGVIQILRRTQPWVYFLSIIGFLNVGLILLLAVVSWVGIETERMGREVPLSALLVYPLMVLLALPPALYLYKYARRIRTFVAQGHQVQLEAALEAQRRFWSFTGCIALAMVILAFLGVVAGMVIGVMAGL